MNTLILGLPRNGKGLYSMQLIIDELVKGSRPIVTNLAVEKFPWITKGHELRRGLVSYLQEKHGGDFNCVERIFRVDDDAMKYFYLYRALSKKQLEKMTDGERATFRRVEPADGVLSEAEFNCHKDFDLYVTNHVIRTDKNGRKIVDSFDAKLMQLSGGHLNVADECWRFWAARSWQSTSDADVFYNAQHGKFGDDNLFVTHRHNDIDSIIVDRCQECVVVTHHGKLQFGMFRQPSVFSVSIFNGRPSPSKEPMSRRIFRLDAKGIAQTYDTSAGVGVTGRGAADVGSRKKGGLPFWSMPILVLGLLFVIGYGIKFGASYVMGIFGGHKKPAVVAAKVEPTAKERPPAPRREVAAGLAEADPSGREPGPAILGGSELDTNDVYCTGHYGMGPGAVVFLSDGSTAYADAGEVQAIELHWVTVFGRRYRVCVGRAVSSYQPAEVEFSPGVVTPARPVNQADVTVIGQDYAARQPGNQSRVGGMAAMQNQIQPNNGSALR